MFALGATAKAQPRSYTAPRVSTVPMSVFISRLQAHVEVVKPDRVPADDTVNPASSASDDPYVTEAPSGVEVGVDEVASDDELIPPEDFGARAVDKMADMHVSKSNAHLIKDAIGNTIVSVVVNTLGNSVYDEGVIDNVIGRARDRGSISAFVVMDDEIFVRFATEKQAHKFVDKSDNCSVMGGTHRLRSENHYVMINFQELMQASIHIYI